MDQTRLSLTLRILTIIALIIIATEIGGMWIELRHIRNEQVKNSLYALPAERLAEISSQARGAVLLKKLENTVSIQGSVSVEGSVDVDVQGTVDVQISNQPVEVEISR